MALKYQVDSLDDVDAAHIGLYEESEDGGFVLQVEGAASQSALDEASRKLRTAERKLKPIERELGAFKEIGDFDTVKALPTQVESLQEQLAAAGGEDIEKVRKQVRKEVEGEYGKRLSTIEGQLQEEKDARTKADTKLQRKEDTKAGRDLATRLGVVPEWLETMVDDRIESGRVGRNEDNELVFFKDGEATDDLFEDFVTAQIAKIPGLTGEEGGGGSEGQKGRKRVAGKRTVDRHDPLALGRAANDVNAGKVVPK